MDETCIQTTAWPAIIFALISIIILSGIALSTSISSELRAWTFIIILVGCVIWVMLIYWFCYLGYHTIGWFMLTLPIFIYLSWITSFWMAKATTTNLCVMGGIDGVWPQMLKSIGLVK